MCSLKTSLTKTIVTDFERKESQNPSLVTELLRAPSNSPSRGAQFNYAGRITQIGFEEGIKAERLNPKLAAHLDRMNGGDILDLGCGRNCPAQSLFDRRLPLSRILSVDMDSANFENYEGNTRNRIFVLDDAQVLASIPDNSVAVVFENLLFNDNDLNGLNVMFQICRVLKEGGIFISGADMFQIKINGKLKDGDSVFKEISKDI